MDRYNLGPSYIIALGDFSCDGGQLWAHDLGLCDIRGRFQCFDGNIPHCTVPWKDGRRYSLVSEFHFGVCDLKCYRHLYPF